MTGSQQGGGGNPQGGQGQQGGGQGQQQHRQQPDQNTQQEINQLPPDQREHFNQLVRDNPQLSHRDALNQARQGGQSR